MKRFNLRHLCELAKLQLNMDEEENLQKDLEKMLSFFEKLKTVNTQGISPLPYPLEINNVSKEDTEKPGFTQEKALINAPEHTNGFFKVPSIIEKTKGEEKSDGNQK